MTGGHVGVVGVDVYDTPHGDDFGAAMRRIQDRIDELVARMAERAGIDLGDVTKDEP